MASIHILRSESVISLNIRVILLGRCGWKLNDLRCNSACRINSSTQILKLKDKNPWMKPEKKQIKRDMCVMNQRKVFTWRHVILIISSLFHHFLRRIQPFPSNDSKTWTLFQRNKMTTNNSIHLEPAYGQYYTEYDPQLHQPVSYPQQYNADAIDTQKSTVRYVLQ